MRIAICTYDQEMIYRISKLLVSIANHMMLTVNIDYYDNADALELEIENKRYELIYFDLQTIGGDYLKIGEKLREKDKLVFIIYISRGNDT